MDSIIFFGCWSNQYLLIGILGGHCQCLHSDPYECACLCVGNWKYCSTQPYVLPYEPFAINEILSIDDYMAGNFLFQIAELICFGSNQQKSLTNTLIRYHLTEMNLFNCEKKFTEFINYKIMPNSVYRYLQTIIDQYLIT